MYAQDEVSLVLRQKRAEGRVPSLGNHSLPAQQVLRDGPSAAGCGGNGNFESFVLTRQQNGRPFIIVRYA